MAEPHIRAADADREAVAAALGRAMAEGRLTVEEYDDRVAQAYAARTYGDLAGLTADLPSALRVPAPQPAAARPVPAGRCGAPARQPGYRAPWGSWATTAAIVLTIWLITSIASGHLGHFWPFWVLGPWGFVLISRGAGRNGGRRPPDRLPR